MRNLAILLTATSLAACGGGGAQSVSSTAAAAATGTSTPAATPTPASTFIAPTVTKTYQSQAAVQSFNYDYNETLNYTKDPVLNSTGQPVLDGLGNPTYAVNVNTRRLVGTSQTNQLYTANASTVRSPGVTVTYDPRNAQFTLVINQNGLSDNITFQDPAHRTDFRGATRPQIGVPNLEIPGATDWRTRGVQYLEVSTGSTATVYDVSTFFYELPGTSTQYVTYAGFVRNHFEDPIETTVSDSLQSQTRVARRVTKYERAAFVYGEQTPTAAVPRTGTGTFSGNMIASMVNNPSFDTDPNAGTYFQWISGTANVGVDFATGAVTTSLRGTTLAPLLDLSPAISPTNTTGFTYQTAFLNAGATFTASATARIDLVTTGGFTGTFSNAQFVDGTRTLPVDIVGSALDGAFYGPVANEVGASFRIVGGIPDQRVDIVGSLTGKRP
jgi:hypothetical protein